ncbi:MAG: hypothetical protein KF770_24195 [Anaerolineae bacterium]|nr:hypothetical protein [Anaerolineae bacterium]
MNRVEQNPIIEMSVSIVEGQLTLNVNVPFKWLGIFVASFILWRAPELWKAIETVLSLIGK